ncbi:MAG: hypothetical protein C4294_18135 [Nitrospiraceae bacterium]
MVLRLLSKTPGSAIAAGVGIVESLANENLAPYHSTLNRLGHMKTGVVELASGIALYYFDILGGEELTTVAIRDLISSAFDQFAAKKPFGFLASADTIEVRNLSPNAAVQVIVDGSSVGVQATTDGSGNATIKLSSALSKGKHNIVVIAGSKAVHFVAPV